MIGAHVIVEKVALRPRAAGGTRMFMEASLRPILDAEIPNEESF